MNWIKLEVSTPDKPEVFKISEILGIDPDTVVGKLVRLWVWADEQSVDGGKICVNSTIIDRITFAAGFANALVKVGWLSGRDGRLTIPNFDRHNGQSAKARAISARRTERHRNRGGNGLCNGESVTSSVTKSLPEKRREENTIHKSGELDLEIQNPPQDQKPKKQKGEARIMTDPIGIRIAVEVMGRRETTLWQDSEIQAFKRLGAIEPDDVTLLAEFYAAERLKGDDGRHRRNLPTLLNNFQGEIDKANNWKSRGGDALPAGWGKTV